MLDSQSVQPIEGKDPGCKAQQDGNESRCASFNAIGTWNPIDDLGQDCIQAQGADLRLKPTNK